MGEQEEQDIRKFMVETNHVVDALVDFMTERNVHPKVAALSLMQLYVMNCRTVGMNQQDAREIMLKTFDTFWKLVEKIT